MKGARVLFILFILTFVSSTRGQQQTQTAPSTPSRTGWLNIQLPELPAPPNKPAQFSYNFEPSRESFEIYIPPDYSPETSYGVFAWVSPGDEAGTPRRFEPLLRQWKLLAVSAARCGNEQSIDRRIGLVMSAILQLSKSLNIDRHRLIISGFSGGGRISAMAGFLHPEFWRGAIGCAGSTYYKGYSMLMPVGASSPGINGIYPDLVSEQNVKDARKNVRFVVITGPGDMNLNDSRSIHRALRRDSFQSLLIEEPGLGGHHIANVESMAKALEFVLK